MFESVFFSFLCCVASFSLTLCSSVPQVNNATARVMTNKKMVSPYPNGEALSTLPYGNSTLAHINNELWPILQCQADMGCLRYSTQPNCSLQIMYCKVSSKPPPCSVLILVFQKSLRNAFKLLQLWCFQPHYYSTSYKWKEKIFKWNVSISVDL